MSAGEPGGLAFDPALPQRDRLLDPGRAAELLGADRCERIRVKYRLGESLRVVWRCVDPDGGRRLVAGRAFPDPARAAAAAAASPAACFDRRDAAVYWCFPDDRRLRGLAAVAGQVVQWAPERSATFRRADGRAYLKLYRGDEGALALRRYRALAAAGAAAPRALGYDPAARVLTLDAVDGPTVGQLAGGPLTDALGAFARRLAELHELGPALAAAAPGRPFERLGLRRLVRCAELVAQARPDAGAAVEALVARLAAGAPGPSAGRSGTGPLVLLHGDVHTANAIVSPAAGVVLIDYDQGGLGRPGADVAGLLAQLETLHLCGRASAAEHAVHRRAVLEGYATVRPLPADLAWHEAAALLAERALRAVNGVRVPVLAALAALLDAARGKLA